MSYTIGRYGSTFVTGRYSWRVPPDRRPRMILGVGPRWMLFARLHLTAKAIVMPWWLAERLDPRAMDAVQR